MHFPRFTPAPASARGIAANAGVILSPAGDGLRVDPRPHPPDPTPPSLCAIPLIPAELIHRCCWLLRRVWQQSHCCAAWVLYLDSSTCKWHPVLPPQQAGPAGALLDLGYRGVHVPSSRLRLAGSLMCLPAGFSMVNGSPPPLPAPIDGVHLALAPESWCGLKCVLHVSGGVYPGLAEGAIDDTPDNGTGNSSADLADLASRITLVTDL